MNKDQWINEVMGSARGITRVSINPYLHTRVKAKLEMVPPAKISLQWAFVALAPVMILLFLNLSLWRKPFEQQKNNGGMEQVIRAYSLDDSIYSALEKKEPNEQN